MITYTITFIDGEVLTINTTIHQEIRAIENMIASSALIKHVKRG